MSTIDNSRFELVATAEVEFCSGGMGVARAMLFESRDDEDHGGIVVRCSIKDSGCCNLPRVIEEDDSAVALHFEGDAEGEAMARAIVEVLSHRRPRQPEAMVRMRTDVAIRPEHDG